MTRALPVFIVLLTAAPFAPAWAATTDSTRPGIRRQYTPEDLQRLMNRSPADSLLRRIAETPQGNATDPLGQLVTDMTDVAGDLRDKLTGKPVQAKQDAIIARLDEIIEKLEKSLSSSSSSTGSNGATTANPTKPLPDSAIVSGPGGEGPFRDPAKGKHTLDKLEPEQRERILQSMNDGFPAGYEDLLRDYYKRLASGGVGDNDKPNETP